MAYLSKLIFSTIQVTMILWIHKEYYTHNIIIIIYQHTQHNCYNWTENNTYTHIHTHTHTHIYIYIYIYAGYFRYNVSFISRHSWCNRHGYTSSNLYESVYISLRANAHRKGMNPINLPPYMSKQQARLVSWKQSQTYKKRGRVRQSRS